MKSQFITAFMWMFGGSRRVAEMCWRAWDEERRALTVQAWKEHAQKAFYND